MIPEVKWYGHPAHFCGANKCRFHLATEVGQWMISTVGEYDPAGDNKEMRELLKRSYANGRNCVEIGCNRLYETMVFKTNGKRCKVKECGCGIPEIIPDEIDFEGYNTARAATEGHYRMLAKYASMAASDDLPVDLE